MVSKTKLTEENEEDFMISETFGWQKVKLYNIKHWIFDFGGVMIEKTFTLKNLWQILESDLNIKLPHDEHSYFRKIRRKCGSGIITPREFLEKIVERYYQPKVEQGALPPKKINIDYYLELWFNLYSQLTSLVPEMEEFLIRLHRAGYTVSLMSNTFGVHAKSNHLKGFYEIFDHVFLSNEIGIRKPDLEKYKHVIKKLDTKAKKCVFIDDKLANLVPARQLGFTVIKFEGVERFKEQLSELGIETIEKDLRQKIKKKYEKYKLSKKEYKKTKKAYKKAKKAFLKKKKRSLQKKLEYKRRHEEYMKKKIHYKQLKSQKKDELTSKIRIP